MIAHASCPWIASMASRAEVVVVMSSNLTVVEVRALRLS